MKTLPLAMFLFSLFGLAQLHAQAPQWWTTRGVLKPNSTPDNQAPVNEGQAKNIAVQAYNELDFRLAGPLKYNDEFDAITALLTTFNAQTPTNFYAIKQGQAKNLAVTFYDYLIELGYTTTYPWAGSSNPTAHHALANTGQIKELFKFDVAYDGDQPPNGLPDWWERLHFNNQTGNDPNADADGDGLSNLQEWQAGAKPEVVDSDGDGLSDSQEVEQGRNPLIGGTVPDTTDSLQLRIYTVLED